MAVPGTSGKNAPEQELGLTAKITTAMKKLFGRRKELERGRAVRLPERGFDHPFQDSGGHDQQKEQPRTASVDSSKTSTSFDTASPGH